MEFEAEVASYLAQQCKPRDGARNLRRQLQGKVESPLARELLRSRKKPSRIRVTLCDGSICFQI